MVKVVFFVFFLTFAYICYSTFGANFDLDTKAKKLTCFCLVIQIFFAYFVSVLLNPLKAVTYADSSS